MDLIRELWDAEFALSELLQETAEWRGIFIDYEKPHIARLWRPWKQYRINLHLIYPCDNSETLFHPHGWPSAMKIISGMYKMVVGFGTDLIPPPEDTRISFLLAAGSYYTMPHPNQWHSVRPLLTKSFSVMLTGPRWNRALIPVTKKPEPLLLSSPLGQEMLTFFRSYYSVRNH